MFSIPVMAAENITANMVMQISEDAVVYESADNTADVVVTLKSGTPVIIREDSQGEWCRISYQNIEGYVNTSKLQMIGDVKQIASEFNVMGANMQLIFDSIVVIEQEKRQTRIWGVVIVVLVVAIFGVGIISSLQNNKKER